MIEHEQLMYKVLGKISETNAPIIFKGALIAKLILAENGFSKLDRITRDIDANWVDTPPSMCVLVETVNQSLETFKGALRAEAMRVYTEKKSAGISIIDTVTGDRIISMDITIKPVTGSRVYHYGEASIRGVLVNEILADKITALSGIKMFRRSKDLIDVYALTQCVKVLTTEIFEVINSKQLELGDFSELLTRRDDVEHAYKKLQGIKGKPSFDNIYLYMTKFVLPFAQKDKTPKIWNDEKQAWDNTSLPL